MENHRLYITHNPVLLYQLCSVYLCSLFEKAPPPFCRTKPLSARHCLTRVTQRKMQSEYSVQVKNRDSISPREKPTTINPCDLCSLAAQVCNQTFAPTSKKLLPLVSTIHAQIKSDVACEGNPGISLVCSLCWLSTNIWIQALLGTAPSGIHASSGSSVYAGSTETRNCCNNYLGVALSHGRFQCIPRIIYKPLLVHVTGDQVAIEHQS